MEFAYRVESVNECVRHGDGESVIIELNMAGGEKLRLAMPAKELSILVQRNIREIADNLDPRNGLIADVPTPVVEETSVRLLPSSDLAFLSFTFEGVIMTVRAPISRCATLRSQLDAVANEKE